MDETNITTNGVNWIPTAASMTAITFDNGWIQGISYIARKRKTFWGRKDTKQPEIQARAFFKVVKKGLTKMEKKLYQKLAEEAFEQTVEHAELGQKNVAEQFEKIMSLNLKKAAAELKGYDTFVHTKMIEKYREHLPKNKELVIDDLEEYEKPLPRHVKVKLAAAKKHNIFDSFCVFWIREVVDPILFGQLKEEPDFYYYIDEWDDDVSVADLLKYK
jgi:ferritin-like protein